MMESKRPNRLQRTNKGRTRSQAKGKSRTLKLRRILVPVDFSGKSRQAFDFAVPLAERYGAKIFLVHVIEPIQAFVPYPGEATVAAVDLRPSVEAIKERLSTLAEELPSSALLGKTMVLKGRAYHEILGAAEKVKADLIVIATHGHTGLKHILLGSTAERVVRYAQCAVLTVRRH